MPQLIKADMFEFLSRLRSDKEKHGLRTSGCLHPLWHSWPDGGLSDTEMGTNRPGMVTSLIQTFVEKPFQACQFTVSEILIK